MANDYYTIEQNTKVLSHTGLSMGTTGYRNATGYPETVYGKVVFNPGAAVAGDVGISIGPNLATLSAISELAIPGNSAGGAADLAGTIIPFTVHLPPGWVMTLTDTNGGGTVTLPTALMGVVSG